MSSEPNPYSSPTATAEEDRTAYRNAPVFTLVGVTALIFFVALITMITSSAGRVELGAVTLIALQSAVYGPVLGLLVILFMPVFVSTAGIRCYNFWGLYRLVRWEDIKWAKPINLFGFKYVRVGSVGRSTALWAPLFLAKRREFIDQVIEIAGEGNPISAALSPPKQQG